MISIFLIVYAVGFVSLFIFGGNGVSFMLPVAFLVAAFILDYRNGFENAESIKQKEDEIFEEDNSLFDDDDGILLRCIER